MTEKKPDLSLCLFKFIVRAEKWADAARMLKDALGIDAKQDASDREVKGIYLISCWIKEDQLTKDFYSKIAASNDIAVHSDTKSASLYPKILKETQAVEEKLRWLLLHVSDAVEDYIVLLGGERSDIITKGSLDPLTTSLSFEAMLALLDLDQSWARGGVDDARMRSLISESADFDSFKKSYLEKTTPKKIWDSISELVLSDPVDWETISPKLKTIKALRNKCAHFHTITDDDLSQAQHLCKQIINSLAKKRRFTATDLKAFAELSQQMTQTIKNITETYADSFAPVRESVLSSQKALIDSLNINTSAFGSVAFSQDIAKQFVENSGISEIIKAQQSALSSFANLPKPIISESTFTAASQMKNIIASLNLQTRYWSNDDLPMDTDAPSEANDGINDPEAPQSDDDQQDDEEKKK